VAARCSSISRSNRRIRLSVLFAFAVSQGCADRRPAASERKATSSAVVSSADSVEPHFLSSESDFEESGLTPLIFTTSAGTDTLRNVGTNDRLHMTTSTFVLGFVEDFDERILRAFRYVPGQSVEFIELPRDLNQFSGPKFSPDANHLAYMARDTSGLAYAAVVHFPSMKPEYHGPLTTLRETDSWVDHVSWSNAMTFEIRLDLSVSVPKSSQRTGCGIDCSQRTRGVVDGPVSIDTVSSG
jgi:hypothetical protein